VVNYLFLLPRFSGGGSSSSPSRGIATELGSRLTGLKYVHFARF
jgi:hypothetical protein